MNDAGGIDQAEDLRQQLRAQLAHATMPPDQRKRKLLLWCVRQLLLCTFAWFFWEHTWMRWVFVIGMVFAGVHLVLLFLMPVLLARKVARTERAIDRMSEALKAAEQDTPQPEG